MIRTADALEAAMEQLKPDDAKLMRQLVVDHLPAILLETVGDRLWTKMPAAYLKWIMAKSLAARIVYREGPDDLVRSVAVVHRPGGDRLHRDRRRRRGRDQSVLDPGHLSVIEQLTQHH